MMDKIAIFCSASENIEPVFFEKARELGVWMGQNKKTLVYGGANIGLMECIAKASKDKGSMIMGVIPTKMEERGRASDLVDVTFRTDNLSDRKDVMLNESDVVIALPGGVGTLDEVSMQNTYQAAKAALKQAEDAYQRMKELHEKGSLAEMKWVEVQSKLQQAQSMEAVARKNLTDCKLYAPFSGVIAEKSLEVGQNVVPGVQVLKLVSDDRLKVRISVPETEIARVVRGQKAVIEAPVLNGTKVEGVVTEKGVQANPLSRSYEVNVGIQTKNTGLLPGMVTEVWLQDADKSQACVLPANVLQLDEHNNYFVWLKGADGKASKRVVACGKFTTTGVTVVNGLNEGDEVIVEGQQKVCEGTPLAL